MLWEPSCRRSFGEQVLYGLKQDTSTEPVRFFSQSLGPTLVSELLR